MRMEPHFNTKLHVLWMLFVWTSTLVNSRKTRFSKMCERNYFCTEGSTFYMENHTHGSASRILLCTINV